MRSLFLRAYPGRCSAVAMRQVMMAQARWRSARWLSGFFDQRMRRPRKRLSQEWVRSMTQRRAVNPGSVSIAFFSSPRERMWGVRLCSAQRSRTSG